MKIVVDTNCIISALIKDGISRKILTHLDEELITIDLSRKEIEEHKHEILKKSKTSEVTLEFLLEKLFRKLVVLDFAIVKSYLKEADKIMENIDRDDALFIAAALATKAVIWSDDSHFKKQKKVKVITTKELVEKLGS
jgi:putative PIN family toxin of toxin-antitoxin system